ncbi:MAG TPA: YHYH protein, partial [Rhodothermales bacterium]|nr:YHYH protein [Rhodothermales bacterium]
MSSFVLCPFCLALLTLAFVVIGCSSVQNDTDPVEGVTDITNALLTSRSANCADYADAYTARATDLQASVTFAAELVVRPDGSGCSFTSNAIPNHDFNATGGFVAPVSEQDQSYLIPANPTRAATPTRLVLEYDDGVMLNGVKVDMLAAGCFFVQTGCRDPGEPYRFNPLVAQRFHEDEHHAHTQPDGVYHYHGNPQALFDDSDASTPSPVIGFAADGFPIFGSFFDDHGTVRKAESSYQLKTGQ